MLTCSFAASILHLGAPACLLNCLVSTRSSAETQVENKTLLNFVTRTHAHARTYTLARSHARMHTREKRILESRIITDQQPQTQKRKSQQSVYRMEDLGNLGRQRAAHRNSCNCTRSRGGPSGRSRPSPAGSRCYRLWLHNQ